MAPQAIEVALARVQHAAYVAALEAAGATVQTIAAREDSPDCCFVEDTAVVVGRRALVANPGAPSRRAEVEAVAARESFAAATFAASIVWVPADERYAANAVAIGTHAIVAAEYPRTHEALAAAGFTLHPVPTSEVRKADGSLTCQSILVAD